MTGIAHMGLGTFADRIPGRWSYVGRNFAISLNEVSVPDEAQEGDIAVLLSWGFNTTHLTPSDWNLEMAKITSGETVGVIHTKKLTEADIGGSATGLDNSDFSVQGMMVFRNKKQGVNYIELQTKFSNQSTAKPDTQVLSGASVYPSFCVAMYGSASGYSSTPFEGEWDYDNYATNPYGTVLNFAYIEHLYIPEKSLIPKYDLGSYNKIGGVLITGGMP